MKILKIITMASALCPGLAPAQQYAGDWTGNLNAGGVSLPIVFHIAVAGDSCTATMDSPKQQAFGLKVKAVTATPEKIVLDMSDMGIRYEGSMRSDSMIGIFSQAGQIFAMNLGRATKAAERPARRQDPKPKFNYNIKDVTFNNPQAGIRLAGTLTAPKGKGPFPAAILVTGSGPQNRDEEILGHKPFWVIADHLTRQGIAVLRYDDRGVAGSEGDFSTATTEDFASDARAALDFLRQQPGIDGKRTGIIGHSEGGMIAPMVAASDKSVGFIILLAGPGIPIDSLLMQQTEMITRASGASPEDIARFGETNRKGYSILKNQPDVRLAEEELRKVFSEEMPDSSQLNEAIRSVTSPWFHYFIAYDPQPVLEKVACPVLALNGDKDLQVSSKENLEGIRQALIKGGNSNFRIVEVKNKNHLFQTTTTGYIAEYGLIEETFSPEVLRIMSDWIRKI